MPVAARSSLPPKLLGGIQDALAEKQLNLSIVRLSDNELTKPGRLPRVLAETSSDGLLIDYTHNIPEPMLAFLQKDKAPAVWLNTKQSDSCVYPDDYNAGVQLTEHLLELGHRRIAFINATGDLYARNEHYSCEDRRDGYLQVMCDAGLKPVVNRVAVHERHPGPVRYQQARALLSLPETDRPTAIIGYGPSDLVTYAYAAAQLGLQMPRDLSLACFDNRQQAPLGQTLTTMLIPEPEVGREGVEMLLEVINQPAESAACRAVPMSLVVGESASPLATTSW